MKWTIGIAFAGCIFNTFSSETETTNASQEEKKWDADLFQKDRQTVSSHLEFLLWQPMEGGLSYAQKSSSSLPNGTTFAIGKYHNAQYDLDPGFRLGVSFFRAPKVWEAWATYTHFIANGHNRVPGSASSDEFLNATWPIDNLSTLIRAKSLIHLNYNVFDFLFDRYWIPNEHMRLRMIYGITGSWLSQKWSMNYQDINNNSTEVDSSWRFKGGGIRLGLMVDWYWSRCIYMTARTTFAGYVGNYHNHITQSVSTLSSLIRNSRYADTRFVSNLQFILGPSFQRNFTNLRTEIFAGYEVNAWTNLQEVYHSTGGSSAGSREPWIITGMLATQGLTVRWTMDY